MPDKSEEVYGSANDYSISMASANARALVIAIPMAAGFALLYEVIWGWEAAGSDLVILFDNFLPALGLLIAGIVVHELLHALGWMLASGLPWSAMEFGFSLKALAPYAHCREAMPVASYRIGVLLPGIVLGLFPYIAALFTGNGLLLVFGLIFSLAAAGDILMFWVIRKIPKDSFVKDHPERVGCEIADSNTGN